jgi:hypothetical protein
VTENDPAWAWSDRAGQQAAFAAFRAEIRPHARSAPIRVTGGPAGSYAVAYRSADRLVVAVTNDFAGSRSPIEGMSRQRPTNPHHPPRE